MQNSLPGLRSGSEGSARSGESFVRSGNKRPSYLLTCAYNSGKPVMCQVKGCNANVLEDGEGKKYYINKRICHKHMTAERVMVDDPIFGRQPYRFCHQCGRLEPLTNFDDNKRSCRTRLLRRKVTRQKQTGQIPYHHQQQKQLHLTLIAPTPATTAAAAYTPLGTQRAAKGLGLQQHSEGGRRGSGPLRRKKGAQDPDYEPPQAKRVKVFSYTAALQEDEPEQQQHSSDSEGSENSAGVHPERALASNDLEVEQPAIAAAAEGVCVAAGAGSNTNAAAADALTTAADAAAAVAAANAAALDAVFTALAARQAEQAAAPTVTAKAAAPAVDAAIPAAAAATTAKAAAAMADADITQPDIPGAVPEAATAAAAEAGNDAAIAQQLQELEQQQQQTAAEWAWEAMKQSALSADNEFDNELLMELAQEIAMEQEGQSSKAESGDSGDCLLDTALAATAVAAEEQLLDFTVGLIEQQTTTAAAEQLNADAAEAGTALNSKDPAAAAAAKEAAGATAAGRVAAPTAAEHPAASGITAVVDACASRLCSMIDTGSTATAQSEHKMELVNELLNVFYRESGLPSDEVTTQLEQQLITRVSSSSAQPMEIAGQNDQIINIGGQIMRDHMVAPNLGPQFAATAAYQPAPAHIANQQQQQQMGSCLHAGAMGPAGYTSSFTGAAASGFNAPLEQTYSSHQPYQRPAAGNSYASPFAAALVPAAAAAGPGCGMGQMMAPGSYPPAAGHAYSMGGPAAAAGGQHCRVNPVNPVEKFAAMQRLAMMQAQMIEISTQLTQLTQQCMFSPGLEVAHSITNSGCMTATNMLQTQMSTTSGGLSTAAAAPGMLMQQQQQHQMMMWGGGEQQVAPCAAGSVSQMWQQQQQPARHWAY